METKKKIQDNKQNNINSNQTINKKEKSENTESLTDNKIENKNIIKNKINKIEKKKKPSMWAWPFKILVVALFLSLAFSVVSEMVLSSTGLVVSCLIVLLLLVVSVFADMIGVAVAAASIEPFTAMSSRKVRGSKEAIFLIKNAEKVGSICNDVIGDVCGIISGAAGASIAVKFIYENMGSAVVILIASSVSAVIAGLTIFGKAIFKKYAIDNSTKIMLAVGKFISIFTRKK